MAAPSVNLNKTLIYGEGLVENSRTILMVNPTLGGAANPVSFEFDRRGTGFNAQASTGNPVGGVVNFSTSYDITVRQFLIISLWCRTTRYVERFIDTHANGGVSIMIFDASNNYDEYYLAGTDYFSNFAVGGSWVKDRDQKADDHGQFCIDLNRAPNTVSGILDRTAVTGFQLNHRPKPGGTTGNYNVGSGAFYLCDPEEIVGGEVGDEAGFVNFAEVIPESDSSGIRHINQWETPSINFAGAPTVVYSSRRPFIINADVFKDVRTGIYMYPSLENFGPAEDHTTFLQLDTDFTRVVEDVVSGSATRDYLGTVFSGRDGNFKDWSMEYLGSSLGSCISVNVQYINSQYITFDSSHMHSNPIFDNVDQININESTNLTNFTYRNCVGSGFNLTGSPGDYSSITGNFEDSFTGDEITIQESSPGSYDLSGLRASHTINIKNESTTNAITVTLDPSVLATSTTEGGVVTIDNSVQVSLDLTGLENLSEVRIYDAGTDSEVAGQESVTTGTFSATIPSSVSSVDINIISLGFQNLSLKSVLTNTDLSIPISQIVDRQYENN